MKAKELRNLSIEDLQKRERELRRELFNLRFQLAKGELQNLRRIRAVRKDISKILTIINEKSVTPKKGIAQKNDA